MSLSGCFVNVFDNTNASGVFYIRPAAISNLITTPGILIYSIAYTGTTSTGILLAGEAGANPTRALAKVWQCTNAQVSSGPATWSYGNDLKWPTGGGNTGKANVLLAWSSDGKTAYCGTSSESSTLGGTGWAVGHWPYSKLTTAPSDESAFQYSMDKGLDWNQIGLINTVINQLSDVAAYEKAANATSGYSTGLTSGTTSGSNALYLASLNTDIPGRIGFDSVWRSKSDPLGLTWERILTWHSSGAGEILRINPRRDNASGTVIVFADLTTSTVIYSSDEGNLWFPVLTGMNVKDLALLDDSNMYLLDDYSVRKVSGSGATWTPGKIINTDLLAPAHTICTPLKPTTNSKGQAQELVFVGTEGNSDTEVAWVDFAEHVPKFTQLTDLPVQGDVHVVIDDQNDRYPNIYAAITNIDHNDGNIYRWTMGTTGAAGTSTDWDELDPINRSFFGICMLNDILYGAWNTDITAPLTSTGVDRTLDARVKVPPPPEWDELLDGLPDSLLYPKFTREPTSLHASSNDYNTLWAIDNQAYYFSTQQGCLWQYVDSVARLGPWPTAPPIGALIGPDPSTGRAQQIDFRWRPLRTFLATMY